MPSSVSYPYDRLPACLRQFSRRSSPKLVATVVSPGRHRERQRFRQYDSSSRVPVSCARRAGWTAAVGQGSMSCSRFDPETRDQKRGRGVEGCGLAAGWRYAAARMQHGTPSLQTGASPSTTYENDDCMSPSTDLHIAAAPRPPRSSSAAALAHLTGSSWPSARLAAASWPPLRADLVMCSQQPAVARETWGFF